MELPKSSSRRDAQSWFLARSLSSHGHPSLHAFFLGLVGWLPKPLLRCLGRQLERKCAIEQPANASTQSRIAEEKSAARQREFEEYQSKRRSGEIQDETTEVIDTLRWPSAQDGLAGMHRANGRAKAVVSRDRRRGERGDSRNF